MVFKADSHLVNTVNPAAPSEIGSVRSPISMIILHSAETQETSTSAEGTASYFHSGSGGRSASAHYSVDNNSIVQSVPEANMSWGVMGYNTWAIHIEQAGRAAQTKGQWDDAYSHAMIYGKTIPLVDDICTRRGIVRTFLTVPQLIVCIRSNIIPRGITTHANCTAASRATGRANSGHIDPGPNYPSDAVIKAVIALKK